MKTMLISVALLAILVAFVAPATGQPSTPAATAPAVANDDQETPPPAPEGVSPADPSMKTPDMDEWCCWCCGAMNSGTMRARKGPMGRPLLAPGREGAGRGAGARGLEGRGPKSEMRGARRAGPGGFHHGGLGGGVAAERMLRHAEGLKLTDEQAEQLEKLAYETKKSLLDLHSQIEREELELQNLFRSGNEDLAAYTSHLEAISKARTGVQEARIANFLEAKKVLTAKQIKTIKEKHPRLGMILD